MWTGPTFQRYYQQIDRITREKLDKEDSEYLLKVDFDEYLDFLGKINGSIEEAQWQPLEWDETQMTSGKSQSDAKRTGGRRYVFEAGSLTSVRGAIACYVDRPRS